MTQTAGATATTTSTTMADPGSVLTPAPSGSGGSGQSSAGQTAGTTTPGSSAPASWRDTLPDDLRGDASLSKFNDISALAKSYVNAQALIGRDKIPMPKSDAEFQDVFRRLGLPETLDQYKVDAPKDSKLDAKMMDAFKETAHKAGILPKQAAALLDWYNQSSSQQVKGMQEASTQKQTNELNALKTEWGQGWNKNVAQAQAAVKEFGAEDFLRESGLGNHPQMIKLMAKVGSTLAEDKIVTQGTANAMGGLTPAEAKNQINTLMGDTKGAYWNKDHPGHSAAVEKMQKLHEAMLFQPG